MVTGLDQLLSVNVALGITLTLLGIGNFNVRPHKRALYLVLHFLFIGIPAYQGCSHGVIVTLLSPAGNAFHTSRDYSGYM